MAHYRSIFISDVHLGTEVCHARLLSDFLQKNTCDTLYIVGDLLDVWQIKKKSWVWDSRQMYLVHQLIEFVGDGECRVVYIPGNHDDYVRTFLKRPIKLHGIELHRSITHVGVDGKRYLVIHGDLFDGIRVASRFMTVLGDTAYDFVVWLNSHVNAIRHRYGFCYWSLSSYLKLKVRSATRFIEAFEKRMAGYAARKEYDGVICGHIHHPSINTIDGVQYLNCGDWVDNCSALVENPDGSFELVFWK